MMSSDDERFLFERWGWTFDHVRREWVGPDHIHYDGGTVPLRCEVVLAIEDVVHYTQTPEGEGQLVGFVMIHGVRAKK